MDPELLSILCTPDTREPLLEAAPDLISRVNADIAAGKIKNADGKVVSEPLEEALVSASGKTLYPVRDGIPLLLIGESIGLKA